MAKIKVRSVEWTPRQIEILYQNLMALGGPQNPLKKDKRISVNRMINSIEQHKFFEKTQDEKICPTCKNFILHFEILAKGGKTFYLPMRQCDRKAAYDLIVEASFITGVTREMERVLAGIGGALGYKNHVASLIAVNQPDEEPEGAEYEEETDEEFFEDDSPDPDEIEEEKPAEEKKAEEKKEETNAGSDTGHESAPAAPDESAGAPSSDEEAG